MFPSCFPKNFESEILPITEVDSTELEVYRVIKSGEINREAFLSTWEERTEFDVLDESDPSTYCTSCNLSLSEIKRLKARIMRFHPRPIIAKGTTVLCCGPSQKTKDRTGKKTRHVDWWVYEKAKPELHFTEVREETE